MVHQVVQVVAVEPTKLALVVLEQQTKVSQVRVQLLELVLAVEVALELLALLEQVFKFQAQVVTV
jgi:hypothetical protein